MADHHNEPATPANLPHVVIIGGGFAGLEAAKAFRKGPVRVTLIDRRNHFVFQPLLYQVATATLNPANIASPIRRILRNLDNVEVVLGEVSGIDVKARKVTLLDGELAYDYLIVAAGASHSYLGHDEWAKVAPGLKSVEDAVQIRRRTLMAYEAAERDDDPRRRREWTTFVVVGGGPTGVELAGSLSEIARHDMVHEFRHINPARSKVILIEAGPRVLPAYTEDLSESARKQLEALGVEVRLGTKVTGVDEEGVDTDKGRIEARTVLWGAGVKASSLGEKLGAPLDKNGRVKVGPDLSIPGSPEVFVLGDQMALEQDGKPVPGVAPAAMQAGTYAARTILDTIKGKARKPFRYRDKGILATIGRAKAVGMVGKWHPTGFIAWALWCGIHIFFLIGFRNRFLVMFEWGMLYFFHDRGSRLITGPIKDLLERDPAARAEAESQAAVA